MAFHSLENDPEYINLQTELVWMQQWLHTQRKRLLILFEGRDTAGKGGAIMRFVRYINPRHYRIVALSKPSEAEMGQWYFQRYIQHLPDPGKIAFFDRSWYNRAVVEPVMGFCTPQQYELFIKQVVQFEQMLYEDGLPIIKFWFSIDPEEQKRRLEERQTSPLKQWKLSTVDAQAQARWHDFTQYKEAMFASTSSKYCPWIVVEGNNRDVARLEAMRYVLSQVEYDRKGETGEKLQHDPSIIEVIRGDSPGYAI
ncbi:Thymidylate kinase [Thalassocella blandensis]|nr:Thymidylate kinase [Thalassocella blandensis]